jgi:hypothetical protein
MAFLEGSIAKQLKWLYPTAPERADTWLEQEIYRWVCLVDTNNLGEWVWENGSVFLGWGRVVIGGF